MWANEAGEFPHAEPIGAERLDGFYLFAGLQKLFGFLICHLGALPLECGSDFARSRIFKPAMIVDFSETAKLPLSMATVRCVQ